MSDSTLADHAIKRHPKFYSDDTMVVIRVEDTLFRVHKHLLLKSETFSDMFKVPKVTNNKPEEGSSPDHPIDLISVSVSDFEALLTVLYAGYHPTHPGQLTPNFEPFLLTAAFRLVQMWNFSDLRTYLLPLVEGALDDVDRIVFAREFDIQNWLAPAHKNLCERPKPITTEEARKLGIDSLLFISRMRELFRPPGSADTFHCQSCAGVSYIGATRTCTVCNQSAYPSYCRVTHAHTASTTKALTTKVDQWIANSCVWKE
ncbi:unnamed protein product [Rhizoctonia solani]|uniref:BTB domain-containing protein n=1 Tax=Rhizoctonia solani TaxID=456999 RepID=A0A8H3E0F2_9AGAM|nr:unnamed protein product [Rhizoctonia solani]